MTTLSQPQHANGIIPAGGDVDVVVTIAGVVPSNGGVVTLTKFDPPNAHEFGEDDDNFSETFSFITTSTLTFMPGEWEKTTTVSVSQNAGNNYIIEATALNGIICLSRQILH